MRKILVESLRLNLPLFNCESELSALALALALDPFLSPCDVALLDWHRPNLLIRLIGLFCYPSLYCTLVHRLYPIINLCSSSSNSVSHLPNPFPTFHLSSTARPSSLSSS